MQKFLSVLLAATFFAAAPVFAFDGGSIVGDDEYATPAVDPSYGPIQTEEDALLARRYCPRGWDRVPQYRWDFRHRRWIFVGWTCRRGHHGPGWPGDGGHGGGGWPGDGGRGGHGGGRGGGHGGWPGDGGRGGDHGPGGGH